jgi:hypothetical protein
MMFLRKKFTPATFWANGLMLFLFSPAWGFASLHWDSQRIELTAQPGETTVTGVFRFVNSGSAPITLISVRPSCGCTTAELAQREYAPEARGEIKAVVALGERAGVEERLIVVTTAEAPTAPISLTLRITIPERLTFSSRQLQWRSNEAPVEKSIVVTNASPQKIAVIESSGISRSRGTVRIETLEPGTKYRIFLRPASLSREATLPFSFLVRFADQTCRKFQILAGMQ